MNTPVSFPLAKLLEEKNIRIDTEEGIFYKDEIYNIEEHRIKNRDVLYCYEGFGIYIPDKNEYQTYKISEIVMWLYEKHGIWISVDPENDTNTWFHTITHGKSITVFGDYSSPVEAYEKGIEHILNNMI